MLQCRISRFFLHCSKNNKSCNFSYLDEIT